MAICQKFAEAWVNSKHKAFGYKLKPFSCWHKFLLGVYESPLLGDGEDDPTIEDVVTAVQIFRLSYPQTPSPNKIWVRLHFYLRSWKVAKEAMAVRAYFDDYLSFPEFWTKKESSEGDSVKGRGSPPDVLSTTTALLMLGFSEKEAWDMPIGKAFWYSSVYAIQLGADLDFVTLEEQEMQENIDTIKEDMEEAREKFMKEHGASLNLGGKTFTPPAPPTIVNFPPERPNG